DIPGRWMEKGVDTLEPRHAGLRPPKVSRHHMRSMTTVWVLPTENRMEPTRNCATALPSALLSVVTDTPISVRVDGSPGSPPGRFQRSKSSSYPSPWKVKPAGR